MEKKKKTATDILNFIKSLNCILNASISYIMLLTIFVKVASAKRSFSKLKLSKSYLRSTISQERVNEFVILAIEQDLLENIEYLS